jgi:nucleotide-binding universal stress UspA family protein
VRINIGNTYMSRIKEKYSKILIAIDGSEQSMDAADYAITIAQKDDAELNALYVVSSPTEYYYTSEMQEDQIPERVRKIIRDAKQQSQPWFNKISERTAASAAVKENTKFTTIHLKTEVIISPISVVGNIVEYAERKNVDLIVVGTRGRSGFKRLLLGSVASGIVTYAHCPVLVVK